MNLIAMNINVKTVRTMYVLKSVQSWNISNSINDSSKLLKSFAMSFHYKHYRFQHTHSPEIKHKVFTLTVEGKFGESVTAAKNYFGKENVLSYYSSVFTNKLILKDSMSNVVEHSNLVWHVMSHPIRSFDDSVSTVIKQLKHQSAWHCQVRCHSDSERLRALSWRLVLVLYCLVFWKSQELEGGGGSSAHVTGPFKIHFTSLRNWKDNRKRMG